MKFKQNLSLLFWHKPSLKTFPDFAIPIVIGAAHLLKNAFPGLLLSHSKTKTANGAVSGQTLLSAFDEFISIFEKKA